MYRISNDPRVKKSAELIAGGFESCLAGKKLSDITVSEICLSAHVGRTTFYRLFDNPIDVLQYLVDRALGRYFEKLADNASATMRDILIQYLEAMMGCSDLLDAILMNDRIDILYQAHLKLSNALGVPSERNAGTDERDRDYYLYHVSALAVTYLRVWSKHGKHENAETVYQHIKDDCKLLNSYLT